MWSLPRHANYYKKRHYTFFCTTYKKISSETIQMKFNELSNKLINGFELYIYLIESNIDNGKNLKTKPVDSCIQSKQIAFCS